MAIEVWAGEGQRLFPVPEASVMDADKADKVVSLGYERAGRARDARLWKPIEAVRQLLAEMEAGEIDPEMIYIAMRYRTGDDGYAHPYLQAGMNDIEVVGLLSQHLHFRSTP